MILNTKWLFKLSIGLTIMLTVGFAATAAENQMYIDPTTGMEFVFVKGGTFTMGDLSGKGREEELPTHDVTVGDMYVGIYEVTFAQYDQYCEATGRDKPDDEGWGREQRPVINVSWDDAVAFAEWLSKESGQTYRLPSEAEWEYFARAGTKTNYWMGDRTGEDTANCNRCGSKWDKKSTAPVGSFEPNPWGIYDTVGNVAEWTADNLHKDYKNAPGDGSAWLGGNEKRKIRRGGAWYYTPYDLRSSNRDWDDRDKTDRETGFRLVMTKE